MTVRIDADDNTTIGVPRDEGTVSFNRTLPRQLVHRTATAEVLLTSYHRRSETGFVLGAQLPRTHALYSPIQGIHDPFLFVEAARQAGLAIAHAGFDVPLEQQFVMWTMSYNIAAEQLRLGDAPAHLTLEAECSDLNWRGTHFAGARIDVTGYRDGVAAGNVSVEFTCLSPAVYARLRARASDFSFTPGHRSLPEPVPAERVGRTRPFDVVLAPTGQDNTWRLRVDQTHPVFFDHPVEHIPGMAALEGVRQAVQHHLFPQRIIPTALHTQFHRYIELDQPCYVRVDTHAGMPDRFRVILEQSGHTAINARLAVQVDGSCTVS